MSEYVEVTTKKKLLS